LNWRNPFWQLQNLRESSVSNDRVLPPMSGRNLVDLATVAAAAATAALSETSPPSHLWVVKIAVRACGL